MIDRIRLGLAVWVARAVTAVVRSLGAGAASVLPGSVARRIQPKALRLLARQYAQGVVLVAGTNGKTTTSLLLRSMFEDHGFSVTHNATGANLVNGLTAALLADADWWGRIDRDVAILEVDENVLRLVLPEIRPRVLLALNLFRDQLDRYGEVDTIARRWREAIAPLEGATVVLNADDPALSEFGQQLESQWGDLSRVQYFGLDEPDRYLPDIPHAVDSIYCPRCGTSLDYRGVYLSHLGDYDCPSCGFAKSVPRLKSSDWPQILIGLYNKYNTLAAATTAQLFGVEDSTLRGSIREFKAAFGRAEELVVEGKSVRILLSKNPVGTNETLRAIVELTEGRSHGATVLMVLNDRIPDGTDVSWIWDADMEGVAQSAQTIVVSGDRLYDMALRLAYSQSQPQAQPQPSAIASGASAVGTMTPPIADAKAGANMGAEIIPEPDLEKALRRALDALPEGEILYIVPTYSAMLEVRQILTGRGIL